EAATGVNIANLTVGGDAKVEGVGTGAMGVTADQINVLENGVLDIAGNGTGAGAGVHATNVAASGSGAIH
ncbi:hypothetical protein, partial [Pandoraea communis]